MAKSKAKKAEIPEPEPTVETEQVTVVSEVLPEVESAPVVEAAPAEEKKPELPTDVLRVQVVYGSLGYDEHKYEKGDIFEETRERLSRLSQKHLKYL